MTSECCIAAGAPLVHDYEPNGKLITLNGGLPAYTTGSGSIGILVVPDVFGFPSSSGFTGKGFRQLLQVSDRLAAEASAVVLMFDPFRGEPWDKELFPPKPEDNFMGWIQNLNYAALAGDVDASAAHLKMQGINKLGIVGFCWGATIAVPATTTTGAFGAVGGVHAGFFNNEQMFFGPLEVPFILLQADGDPIDSVKAVMDSKKVECVYHHFEGQRHGFCGARGDWNNPANAAAASKAIAMLAKFYKAHLQ